MADGSVATPVAAPAAPSGIPASQAGQAPTATQQVGESPAQTEARRLKLRLDGQDVELDESEVVANYRKGREASQLLSKVERRRQEALAAQAKADGLLGRIKSDPRGVLRELGVDIRGLSEATILEEIQLEKMTPAERRAYDAEQKLKAYEEDKRRAEEEQQKTVRAQEVERHKDEFSNLFLGTMEALGLPKASGRFVAHRMAHLYAQNEAAGLESTPEEMAAHVMAGLQKEHTGVLSGYKGKALLEYLGPSVVREVLSAHLAGIREKRGQPTAAPVAKPAAMPTESLDPRKGRWAEIERLIKTGK